MPAATSTYAIPVSGAKSTASAASDFTASRTPMLTARRHHPWRTYRRSADRRLPSGRRRLVGCRAQRAQRRHHDGIHAAGRPRHGHPLRHRRSRLVLWLEEQEKLAPHEVATELEQRSGLLALAGTADTREVEARGDSVATLALAVYTHRLVAGIAAMTAATGGWMRSCSPAASTSTHRPCVGSPMRNWRSSASPSTRATQCRRRWRGRHHRCRRRHPNAGPHRSGGPADRARSPCLACN
jgi:Acetokinase family